MLAYHLTDKEDDAGIQQDGSIRIHLGTQRDGEAGNLFRDSEFLLGDFDIDWDGSDGTAGG